MSILLKLLEFTGSRSLKDIAIVNARAIIRQVFDIKTSWFTLSSKRSDKKSLLNKNKLPKSISSTMKNTLVSKILDLAKCYTRAETTKKQQQLATKQDKIPKFQQLYTEVKKYLELSNYLLTDLTL